MKYLVTSRGGGGKTAVHNELLRRGINSVDTDDVPGLANWVELATGAKIKVDAAGFIDYSKIAWDWDQKILKDVLSKPGELFLCGSASNQLDFHPLFDWVGVLTLDKDTQRQRLVNRGSRYGKHPDMQDIILQEQEQLVKQAVDLGATPIDNTRPITEVVDRIVELARG